MNRTAARIMPIEDIAPDIMEPDGSANTPSTAEALARARPYA
jgi:hypothetical protein